VLDAGKHADLPIGDVSREDDHPATGCNRPIHMFEAMRLDPPARLENADFPQMWVFGGDARLSHMPVTMRSISVSESSGKARLMLHRACLETPRKGPMRRASAPPKAEAQSSGNNSNTPNKGAAPQASRRSANPGASSNVRPGRAHCRGPTARRAR
jgi:hypothetical protein